MCQGPLSMGLVSLKKKANKMNRKDKIREYKDTPRPMGIYQIKNKVNGKVLIGSSLNLQAILNRFKSELEMCSCRNSALQDEWNQFGPDAFEFKVLEVLEPLDNPTCDPSEDLQFLEAFWLKKINPYGGNGYNKAPKSDT